MLAAFPASEYTPFLLCPSSIFVLTIDRDFFHPSQSNKSPKESTESTRLYDGEGMASTPGVAQVRLSVL